MPKKGENVYHRKDGLWEARYVKEIDLSGKKKYGSVYARTCREAKEKRQVIVDSIRLNQVKPITRNTTMSQLISEWMYLNKNRLKPSTYQKYLSFQEKHIDRFIGDLPVIYFTTVTIHQYAQERIKEGISVNTVNAVLVFIHTCLKYGHRQYNFPMPDIIYPAQTKKEMRVLSYDEQKKLTDYLKQDTDIYKFGVLLALYTGLRVGELCALEWNDIEDGRIKVRRTVQRLRSEGGGTEVHIGLPKTQSSIRDIPVPSFLSEIIEHFRKQNTGKRYVISQENSKLAEPRIMQYKCRKYLNDLGIQGATFHTLRHSFATRCVECQCELKSLSEMLGHTNITTTVARYVHSSFQLKQNTVERLREVMMGEEILG